MSYQTLLTEIVKNTLIITFNRPKVLNALNRQVLEELYQALEEARNNDKVKGIIITGAGDKAFAAGADISELSAQSKEQAVENSLFGQKVFDTLAGFSKPIIAAINGFALGGGCELAMGCHIRIASHGAKFGQPEVKIGLLPGYGATQRLPQLIGRAKATELILTGEIIGAEEALDLGLVSYLVTREELKEKCFEILEKIYKQSPKAIALSLEAIQEGFETPNGYAREAENFGIAITSEDGREGTAAFLEKRKPNFTGK
ncbi:MAG: enoyl-CoA hydratase/isomerase family protein [Bacteroidetes bacterium]|nr:enoyl-CoA hydratase/isomerase family protein [Bacteroidota bacterium]